MAALWPEGGLDVSATWSASLNKKNKSNSADNGSLLMELRMPNVTVSEDADDYLCVDMEMPMYSPYHITQYTGDLQLSGTRSAYSHVHHMVS